MISPDKWKEPERRFCANPIVHAWPENRTVLMDAIKDYGFGGVVTNPSYANWYEGYEENAKQFKNILNELDARNLTYWIYDEKGYPSGYAGGETLVGHPELEAKGFYMRRMVAYEPRHVTFRLDDESDKIVWAAKYNLDTPGMHESFLIYNSMTPVTFSDTFVETDLQEKQAFFVFCVKPAYEGSHCTHNVSSYSRYINIMDPRAIKRFIELMLEPIAKSVPDAFSRAKGVFTDEPSLQVGYARPYESWPYALAPYVDGIFDEYKKEYKEEIYPYLPLIFEGRTDAYPIRVNFYRLVGKLIAQAYSGQLSEWCRAHGGRFSGHYLGEETIVSHVKDYGSNIEVIRQADYPGLDMLSCYPEIFCYNTVKHPQMVSRKKGTDGMMVEICPFDHVEEFMKAPIDNMTGMMGILYMHGARVTHSYFSSDFSQYNPDKLPQNKGTMGRQEAQQFNRYIGRLGMMLTGLTNDTHIFVYYSIEDVSAKMVPQTAAFSGAETQADQSAIPLTKAILEGGFDFYYADRDDLLEAQKSGYISGHRVDVIIIPALDVLYDESYKALETLKNKGVKVLFLDKVPQYGTVLPTERTERTLFTPVDTETILDELQKADCELLVSSGSNTVLKARYQKEGCELWMFVNHERHPISFKVHHKKYQKATLYDTETGIIEEINLSREISLETFRSCFLYFDK